MNTRALDLPLNPRIVHRPEPYADIWVTTHGDAYTSAGTASWMQDRYELNDIWHGADSAAGPSYGLDHVIRRLQDWLDARRRDVEPPKEAPR